MYNLNYLYLHDLNIDTSRSARDISASAMFVSISGKDYTAPVSSVTNRFVDWFFKATNPNIPLLNVTFGNAFLTNRPLTAYSTNSVRTYGEVYAAISAQLKNISAAMFAKLQATVSALSAAAVTPVGSVVINKTNPSAIVSGTWTSCTNRFIQEASTTTGLLPISAAALSAYIISSAGVTPKHTHEVVLTPSSKSVSAKVEGTVTGLGGYEPGGWVYYKATDLTGLNRTIRVSGDGWDANDAMDSGSPISDAVANAYKHMITVASAGVAGETKSVNVSPDIDQLSATIFTKTA